MPDSTLRVDIALTPRPVRLSQVRVIDKWRMRTDSAAPDVLDGANVQFAARRFAGAQLHANPAFGDPDVLQTLSILPDVGARPEFPTALHVRGGSGDQNLILLDGVPLYNAYHAAGALTALNPDVVSAISISPGAVSARHGGALSSVVSIVTTEPAADSRVEARGSLGSRAVGHTVSGTLPGDVGTIVVSGRRSTPQLFPGFSNQTSSSASFGDFFAKGTLRSRLGALEVFSYSSADRLAFDARVDAAPADAGAAMGADPSASATVPSTPPQNGFAWRTRTDAIIWRSRHHAPVELSARAWRTRFDAVADWAATTGPVHLASALSHDGIAADASRHFSSSTISGGVSGERVQTGYGLRHAGVRNSAGPIFSTLDDSRVMLSAFLEDEWRLAPRWTLTLGVRGLPGGGHVLDVDPRASVLFAPSPRFAASVGYARTHQYVQSLRNEESIIDAVVGIALPVVAGPSGAPVARSDALTLSADSYLGSGATLSLSAYARWFDGLLLVAPTIAQPFAMSGLARGTGEASGLSALLDWHGERVSGHAGYAFGTSRREAAGQRYRSSFAGSHAFNMAIGYRAGAATVWRAALWSSTGRPTSVVNGDLQWAPHSLLSGADEMAGTPERIVGALNGERLTPYARVDFGVRRALHLGWNGRGADVTAVLNLTNVLNRANSLGRTLSTDGYTRRDIPMAPRTLTFGLEWRL